MSDNEEVQEEALEYLESIPCPNYFPGICSMCNQLGLLQSIALGDFCGNCIISASKVRRIICPICRTGVSVSRLKLHYEMCPDPYKTAKVIL